MAYNALHTALEAAVNAVLATTLCAEIDLTMAPRYELGGEGITGPGYRVECETTRRLTVALTPPTKREDGTPLHSDEIRGYEFEILNGCVTGRTVLTDGLRSAPVTSCYQEAN